MAHDRVDLNTPHFNSNDTDALLIVLGVLDEELPTHTSGQRIALGRRIVACLSEVQLIPED